MASDTHPSLLVVPSAQEHWWLDDSLSIRSLLQYPTWPPSTSQPDFSDDAADDSFTLSERPAAPPTEELRQRPLPSPEAIRRTLSQFNYQQPHSYQSFLDHRIQLAPTPLWMLTVWDQLVLARDHVSPWMQVSEWLAAEAVLRSFTTLPWNHRFPAVERPRSGVLYTRHLLSFFAPQPVSPILVDAMITALNWHLRDRQMALHATVLTYPYSILMLKSAAQGWPQYPGHFQYNFLRSLSRRIQQHAPPLTSVFIPWKGDHGWALYALDIPTKVIQYASSLDPGDAAVAVAAIRSWLATAGMGQWDTASTLPYGGPDDGRSSSIIVMNAIKHALWQEPLWTPETSHCVRMHEYLALLQALYNE
ncbi:hypothetical protein C8Q76DRAFT_801488 [Earliella scabrosa]|nr:hypothetical protein C8Q76DRAFT_801488 [Earliella scabrosa]